MAILAQKGNMKVFLFFLLFVSGTAFSQKITNLEDARRFIAHNIVYPREARDSNFTGYVLTRFTIKRSKLIGADIVFSENNYLGESVLSALIKTDGKWGIKVRHQRRAITYLMPVYFMLSTSQYVESRAACPAPRMPYYRGWEMTLNHVVLMQTLLVNAKMPERFRVVGGGEILTLPILSGGH